MVMAQTLLNALKQDDPQLEIDVLAPPVIAQVAIRMAEVRAVVDAPFSHGRLQFFNRLRAAKALRGRYDLAYVLPNSFKSSLVPWFAGIGTRTGYVGERRYGLINDIKEKPKVDRRKTAQLYRNLAGPGFITNPSLLVDCINREKLLARFGLIEGKFIAIAPGAEFGSAKRWPGKKYAELANELIADKILGPQIQVAAFGSPADASVGEKIATCAPGVLNLCGKTCLADAIDLMSAAALVVSNDSGLMHIAAALQRPIVAIYGSTSSEHTPPLSDMAVTLSEKLSCSPCFSRICPLEHLNCLNTLSVTKVRYAIDQLLK
jgi:heptosyltransferase-2